MAGKNAQGDAIIFWRMLAGDNDGKLLADERGSRVFYAVYGYPDLPRGVSTLLGNSSSLFPSYLAITEARSNRGNNVGWHLKRQWWNDDGSSSGFPGLHCHRS